MGQARAIKIPDHQLNRLVQHLINKTGKKEKGCDLNETTLAET